MNQQYVPFLKNVGVQSADFDEARQFINSRIDDREVLPMSAGSDTENILTWQPLDGSTLFGARWSEKVHIQSEPQTTFHAILVLSGCIHCKTTKRDITAGGILLIAPGQQADVVQENSIRSVVSNLFRQPLVYQLVVAWLEMLQKTLTTLSQTDNSVQLVRQGNEN